MTPLKLLFVGNHFARKGGLVALRVAQLAKEAGLPVELEIVSGFEIGAVSWTDPLNEDYFTPFWEVLKQDNVTTYDSLPNKEVIGKIRQAHFVMLPTFGDTFGYSAIEAMAQGTLVIGTAQSALPEFIEDGVNGFLSELPVNHINEWEYIAYDKRDTAAFEDIHRREVENLSQDVLAKLKTTLQSADQYKHMRKAAYHTAKSMFDAEAANEFWDDYYCAALKK